MITGGIVKKVNAEHFKNEPQQGMDINIQIREAQFEPTKATVSYTYEMTYKPGVAKMVIEGEIYMEESEKEVKAWKEHWAKKTQFPDEVASDLVTALNYTASAIGTLLAFAVNINAPINVPRARMSSAPQETKPAA
jgi:hypothetical protein